MPEFLDGDDIELENQVRLRAVSVDGVADEVTRAPDAGRAVRDVEPGPLPDVLADTALPADAAGELGSAAESAGMRRALSVPLRDLRPRSAPGGGRDQSGAPQVVLTVPAPTTDDEGQVVLEIDDAGLVRWHLPELTGTDDGRPADRSASSQTFRVPVAELEVPDGSAGERGILGLGLTKILHVIRFPIEAAAGAAGRFAVGLWEDRFRPYGLAVVDPGTIGDPLPEPGATPEQLAALADKPFLLLVHGTFSTVRAGFAGLAADPHFAELCARYPGRVLAFDHPTLEVDPTENVRWFLSRLPTDVAVTVDVVSHSRGGLVARELSSAELAADAGRPLPVVRTLVHVATPNAGTVLASPDRLGTLLNVLTTTLSLFPDGPTTVTLDGVLEVVKQVATGVLGGLDGLAAMDPAGGWLAARNGEPVPVASTVRAVASNYEPADGASLAARGLDVLVDGIFSEAGNDLVVPTSGVSSAGQYVVADPFITPMGEAVMHTGYFGKDDVRAAVRGWLPGS